MLKISSTWNNTVCSSSKWFQKKNKWFQKSGGAPPALPPPPESASTTGDLIGKKFADKITKVSRSSRKNNSETITNEHGKEIPKETFPEERQKNIGYLRLI